MVGIEQVGRGVLYFLIAASIMGLTLLGYVLAPL